MQFGAYLSGVGECSDPNLLAELAHEAEETGWDGVFFWDHIGRPNSAVDPWVALAAMAMRTQRVRLGPVVTPVARRRPWKLARETVSLDHLSGGRLTLGVGLGWGRGEFETFGEEGEPRTRARKLDEGLDVLAGLWSGESFTHDGETYHIKDACFLPRPVPSPRIPMWACGAWSDRRAPFRRAARWDGVIAIADPGENRAIRPDEVHAIRLYMERHRTTDDPFDVVVILWSEGDGSAAEAEETSRYAAAGATWWLEDLSLERFGLDEARVRLRKGPPATENR